MSEPDNNPPGEPNKDPGKDPGFVSGPLHHQQLSARVPESVAKGVFSTGAIVITGPSEFVLDFLLRMSRPHQVAARVVLPLTVVPQVINALRENIGRHTEQYGPIKELPKVENDRKVTIQEIYDDLKIPDEILSGVYANGVMIGHTPSEFAFDFFTNFFPHSAVSSRIYISASQAPRLLDTLTRTYQDYLRRLAAAQAQHQLQQQQQQAQQAQQPPPRPPEAPETPERPTGDQPQPPETERGPTDNPPTGT